MSSKDIWNKIKLFKTGRFNHSKSSNFNWIDEFLNSLTPDFVTEKLSLEDITIENDGMNAPFEMCELENAIKCSLNTSPGYDNIHYPMIKKLSPKLKTDLLEVFNEVWLGSLELSDWRRHVVIPILKPGKDPNVYNSYRPIALSSCICKTFERMIKFRLNWWIETNEILSQNQYGFRKGRSTLDQLSYYISDLKINLTKNNHIIIIIICHIFGYSKSI